MYVFSCICVIHLWSIWNNCAARLRFSMDAKRNSTYSRLCFSMRFFIRMNVRSLVNRCELRWQTLNKTHCNSLLLFRNDNGCVVYAHLTGIKITVIIVNLLECLCAWPFTFLAHGHLNRINGLLQNIISHKGPMALSECNSWITVLVICLE